MSIKTETSNQKSISITLEPGEIFVSFMTDRKSNTDILLESYFNTVFPVAIENGAVPLGNLNIDFVSKGDFNATDFIGISKWKSPEGAASFTEIYPEEKLNELRKPIWNNFKIVATPVIEKMSFDLIEGKVYEYKLLWGGDVEIDQTVASVEDHGGEILFDLAVVNYSDFLPEEPPKRVVLVEWDSHTEAFDHSDEEKIGLKEEAFYTYFTLPKPVETKVNTNHLALEIPAPADKVWEVIATGDYVDRWFPYINSCSLDDTEDVLKRRCTTVDGKTLEESLVKIDKENKVFVYTVDRHDLEMPIQNIRGIMRVIETDGNALIDWTVHFELTQEIDEQMLGEIQKGMVESMRIGIKGIEDYLN